MAVTNPVTGYVQVKESRNGSPEGTRWRPVVTERIVPEIYEVSETGLVANLVTGKLLKTRCAPNSPILIVSLKGTSESGVTSARIDKLVLEAFVGQPAPGQVPIYLDGDKANCTLANLNWGPPPEGEVVRKYHPPRKKKTSGERRSRRSAEMIGVQVDRRYRFRGVTAVVHMNGAVELTVTGSRHTLNLSAETFTALARVTAQIDEMNRLVGGVR